MPDDPAPHEHKFEFLRQEMIYDNPSRKEDVFVCTGCLEYRRVEVWRGRYRF